LARNRSNNIFYSSAGATEGEKGSATFLAAGHWATEGEMGGMGPPIFFTAALTRPRVKKVQQHFSQWRRDATAGKMGSGIASLGDD
jgi:hypothetical protein